MSVDEISADILQLADVKKARSRTNALLYSSIDDISGIMKLFDDGSHQNMWFYSDRDDCFTDGVYGSQYGSSVK